MHLYESLYVIRPGGSYDGSWNPSAKDRASQAELLQQAKDLLERARNDEADIDADYNRQMKKYIDLNGSKPTNKQLVEADMAHLPQAYHDLVESMAEGRARVEADSDDDELTGGAAGGADDSEAEAPGWEELSDEEDLLAAEVIDDDDLPLLKKTVPPGLAVPTDPAAATSFTQSEDSEMIDVLPAARVADTGYGTPPPSEFANTSPLRGQPPRFPGGAGGPPSPSTSPRRNDDGTR